MRVHVFVDAENINPKLFKAAYKKLAHTYEIVKINVYGKKEYIPSEYNKYSNIEFRYANTGKNNADIMLGCDMIYTLWNEPLTNVYVIITQDCDFSYPMKLIASNAKKVMTITEKNHSIRNLHNSGAYTNNITHMQIDLATGEIEDISSQIATYKNHTCFIKYKKRIYEVPFMPGIALTDFGMIFRNYDIKTNRTHRLSDICKNSLLNIIDGKVYYKKEEEYED